MAKREKAPNPGRTASNVSSYLQTDPLVQVRRTFCDGRRPQAICTYHPPMSFDIRKFFEHPFTATRPERQVLFVPVHADIGKEPRQSEVRTVLARPLGR